MPYVPPELISSDAFLKLDRIAQLLPSSVTDFFGFECLLGSEAPTADFLICSRVRHGSREVLAAWQPDVELSPSADSIWLRLRRFAQEWTNAQSPLYNNVHNLWLEFDVDPASTHVPPPNVFIGSDSLCAPDSVASDSSWLPRTALPMLLGHQVSRQTIAVISRCVNSLPSYGHIFQVGLMLARSSAAVRLCIRGLSGAGIPDYLVAIGWDGCMRDVKELIDSFTPITQSVDLDVDVIDRVLPKVGLELYPGNGMSRLHLLVDHLVSAGLCTPCKAAALRSWPGMAEVEHKTFRRSLHHIKVVLTSDVPLLAKAYLGVHENRIVRLNAAPAALTRGGDELAPRKLP